MPLICKQTGNELKSRGAIAFSIEEVSLSGLVVIQFIDIRSGKMTGRRITVSADQIDCEYKVPDPQL